MNERFDRKRFGYLLDVLIGRTYKNKLKWKLSYGSFTVIIGKHCVSLDGPKDLARDRIWIGGELYKADSDFLLSKFKRLYAIVERKDQIWLEKQKALAIASILEELGEA